MGKLASMAEAAAVVVVAAEGKRRAIATGVAVAVVGQVVRRAPVAQEVLVGAVPSVCGRAMESLSQSETVRSIHQRVAQVVLVRSEDPVAAAERRVVLMATAGTGTAASTSRMMGRTVPAAGTAAVAAMVVPAAVV